MATVKYKVTASYTDCLYFSRIVEVDTAIYPSQEDQMNYVEEYSEEDAYPNFEGWDADGNKIIDYLTIESIEKI